MKKSIYTILDEKGCSIGPLFVAASDDEAERIVCVALSKGDTLMTQYPADFALLRLGDIKLDTGSISAAVPIPVLVRKVDELIRPAAAE